MRPIKGLGAMACWAAATMRGVSGVAAGNAGEQIRITDVVIVICLGWYRTKYLYSRFSRWISSKDPKATAQLPDPELFVSHTDREVRLPPRNSPPH